MNLANSIWYRNNAMFNVHVWAYSVLLYTVSVGFGIAYSVPRAMREPHERDKQRKQIPALFLYAPLNTTNDSNVKESRWKEVAPDTN